MGVTNRWILGLERKLSTACHKHRSDLRLSVRLGVLLLGRDNFPANDVLPDVVLFGEVERIEGQRVNGLAGAISEEKPLPA